MKRRKWSEQLYGKSFLAVGWIWALLIANPIEIIWPLALVTVGAYILGQKLTGNAP